VHQDGQISRCASHHRQEGPEVGCKRTNRQEHQTHEVGTRQGRLGRDPVAHVLPLKIHAYLSWHAHGRSRCLETIGHRQDRSKSV
jgi:hypothetical protein